MNKYLYFLLGEDLKNEIHALQKAMYKTFIQEGKMPVYDPYEFYNFCRSVNAQNVFDFIFSTISSTRHSKDRKELNKKRTVAFLYKFCFCISQKCDSLQKDNGIFIKFCHLTDEGLDTQRTIGTSLCSRSLKRKITDSAKSSGDLFNSIVEDAIKNEYLVTLMIDDWTKVYTKKRPTDERTSMADNFCTIVIKVTKDVKAIPFTEPEKIHNPHGIAVDNLTNFVFSQPFLKRFLLHLFQHFQSWEFCFSTH